MTTDTTITEATADDLAETAVMVGELLGEIMRATGSAAFNFNLEEAASRLKDFVGRGKYVVFLARDDGGRALGFVGLYESYALYAEGAFGTIAEFYVRPAWRSRGVGGSLLARAASFGRSRGWRRLEVTTPTLPHFERTLRFYEREGFAVTGGRKLKVVL